MESVCFICWKRKICWWRCLLCISLPIDHKKVLKMQAYSAYHIKTKHENIEIGLAVYIWCYVWELFLFFSLTACQGYMHGFTKCLKLEDVNPNDPSSICAAMATKIPSKFFFQVEIDSIITCSDSNRPTMWCNSNSRNIFPVGRCAQNNIQLTLPPGMQFLNTAHLISMFVFCDWNIHGYFT